MIETILPVLSEAAGKIIIGIIAWLVGLVIVNNYGKVYRSQSHIRKGVRKRR